MDGGDSRMVRRLIGTNATCFGGIRHRSSSQIGWHVIHHNERVRLEGIVSGTNCSYAWTTSIIQYVRFDDHSDPRSFDHTAESNN